MIPRVVRWLLIAAGTASCYDPTPAENVPCSAAGTCPEGQQCVPATQRCARTLPIDAGIDGLLDAPVDTTLVDVAPDAPLTFIDGFDRNNGEVIGNGWIEKVPSTFFLSGSRVMRAPATTSYRDNLVYRPAMEDLRDVEISIDVRFTELPPDYPQIFVRGVSSSIAAPDSYSGYLLYVDGDVLANEVVLSRQIGTVFAVTLSRFTLTESFVEGTDYRFALRAVGETPVELEARIHRLTNGNPVLIGQTTALDSTAMRIVTPGTVGFSGDDAASYSYDNFRRAPL